jgi:phytoene dehydrogenase-like protein
VRPSYRQLAERNRSQATRIERLITERDEARDSARACASQLERIAAELSRAKDIVALHIVAAGHPSTVVHDVQAFADSLREALAAVGVDIRLELGRLEGAEL